MPRRKDGRKEAGERIPGFHCFPQLSSTQLLVSKNPSQILIKKLLVLAFGKDHLALPQVKEELCRGSDIFSELSPTGWGRDWGRHSWQKEHGCSGSERHIWGGHKMTRLPLSKGIILYFLTLQNPQSLYRLLHYAKNHVHRCSINTGWPDEWMMQDMPQLEQFSSPRMFFFYQSEIHQNLTRHPPPWSFSYAIAALMTFTDSEFCLLLFWLLNGFCLIFSSWLTIKSSRAETYLLPLLFFLFTYFCFGISRCPTE